MTAASWAAAVLGLLAAAGLGALVAGGFAGLALILTVGFLAAVWVVVT